MAKSGRKIGVNFVLSVELAENGGQGLLLLCGLPQERCLEPKFALRAPFGALSGQLAPLGRSLIPSNPSKNRCPVTQRMEGF